MITLKSTGCPLGRSDGLPGIGRTGNCLVCLERLSRSGAVLGATVATWFLFPSIRLWSAGVDVDGLKILN